MKKTDITYFCDKCKNEIPAGASTNVSIPRVDYHYTYEGHRIVNDLHDVMLCPVCAKAFLEWLDAPMTRPTWFKDDSALK